MPAKTLPDHYATLGLDRKCTLTQIRAAYRLLAKRHHPDVNGGDSRAVAQTQALNAAQEVLSDPARRAAYDRELAAAERAEDPRPIRTKIERNVSVDAHLRVDEFLRGTSLNVRLKDPANPAAGETYRVEIPAGTAPGSRVRVPRAAPFDGGHLQVRLKVRPGGRFKASGVNLRCELRISSGRAAAGGIETFPGPTGGMVRVSIPARAARGAVVKVPGEGLPKPHGGRGDLLVKISYRIEAGIERSLRR
jgi:curved DNA-binding protein